MTRVRAFALLAVALATTACSTKDDTTTNSTTDFVPAAPVADWNRAYTLQGFVADATTGARIGGGDLQLFLIQGAAVRTPTRLNAGAADPLLGEFAFADIPLDANDTNKFYKIVAVKPGYQRFEAEISNQAVIDNAPVINVDTIYNVIGNIFMFPVGATTPPFQFTVLYNGKPVPNATVVLDPATNSNNPLFNTAHALSATTGYLASLTATTDALGVATFPGASLALGAPYQAQVLPVTYVDSAGTPVPLARFDGGANVIAGLANVQQTINLSDLVWDNLYVVSTSNQAVNQVNALGALVVTFNAPVTLRNPTGFTCGASGTGVLGTPSVNASLSADGRVLTLTPIFTTPPPELNGVTITYANGTAFVEANDYPGLRRDLFAGGTNVVQFVGGGNIPTTVIMRAP